MTHEKKGEIAPPLPPNTATKGRPIPLQKAIPEEHYMKSGAQHSGCSDGYAAGCATKLALRMGATFECNR